jgi:dephospho-CoA kinase
MLAGGIGSGKSMVASLLAERGALVIDADQLGHRVLEPDGEAFDAVSQRWPQVVVDGKVDRSRLGSIVFDDPAALVELEAISHPAILSRIRSLVGTAGAMPVVVEIPVIIPLGGDVWMHLFVDAPEDLRVERVTDRGGDPADTRRRIEAQPSRTEWFAWADRVLVNDGSEETLRAAVDDLWNELIATGQLANDG